MTVNPSPGTSALIPAAGTGTRLGLGPKCLLKLGEHSLLQILVATLKPLVDEIIIGAPASLVSQIHEELGNEIRVVPGGESRQGTIDKLCALARGDILLIQDAARPFASRTLCRSVITAATEHGAAGAFLDPMVPVGRLQQGMVSDFQTRQQAAIFQAPQAYRKELLARAREQTLGQDFQSTAEMVITAGITLRAVAGEPENIKITTELDWQIAQNVIGPALNLV